MNIKLMGLIGVILYLWKTKRTSVPRNDDAVLSDEEANIIADEIGSIKGIKDVKDVKDVRTNPFNPNDNVFNVGQFYTEVKHYNDDVKIPFKHQKSEYVKPVFPSNNPKDYEAWERKYDM